MSNQNPDDPLNDSRDEITREQTDEQGKEANEQDPIGEER